MSELTAYQTKYAQILNEALKNFIEKSFDDKHNELKTIFEYQVGYSDPLNKQGKRIRPLITLLCAEGSGGDWKKALPAALAIELVHNFSLIHDDIEDNGFLRRGKESVWKKWGLPKGLNSGDAMFACAYKALCQLDCAPEILKNACVLLSETCLQLTKGQQLDLDFEERNDVLIKDYYEMISGKTAALLGCSAQLGALIAECDSSKQENYFNMGYQIGISFQIYDDWLGIWGDPLSTGKSISSDLVERKKSLPVLLGLQKSPEFLEIWKSQKTDSNNIRLMAETLKRDGIEGALLDELKIHNDCAINALHETGCCNKIQTAILELIELLVARNK